MPLDRIFAVINTCLCDGVVVAQYSVVCDTGVRPVVLLANLPSEARNPRRRKNIEEYYTHIYALNKASHCCQDYITEVAFHEREN